MPCDGALESDVKVDYVHNADPTQNDQLLNEVPPGSLVVNGTGMGKDSPGSPISDEGEFPERALVGPLLPGRAWVLASGRAPEANTGADCRGWLALLHRTVGHA